MFSFIRHLITTNHGLGPFVLWLSCCLRVAIACQMSIHVYYVKPLLPYIISSITCTLQIGVGGGGDANIEMCVWGGGGGCDSVENMGGGGRV